MTAQHDTANPLQRTVTQTVNTLSELQQQLAMILLRVSTRFV